jgi:hypothetical protein
VAVAEPPRVAIVDGCECKYHLGLISPF